ncbi:hypothetical protein D3C72_2016880 [compost metagenome]
MACLIRKAQVQADNIHLGKKRLTRGGSSVAIGFGCGAAVVAAPHQHGHVEGLRITRQALADLAIAPDAQRLPGQRLA